jgi:hypothetical protein
MSDLFGDESEWVGMPEFVQEKQEPFSQIIVRFETEADLMEFAEMIGQPLTAKTKSIWHPQLQRGINRDKVYVDES